jgi:hypothetical protein
MIRNKKDLLRKLDNLAEMKIKQGLDLKALQHSLRQHYKDKDFKEWKELASPLIERLGGEE